MIEPSTPAVYDTIIIGSGAGALAAAICLSQRNQKVLVLEQHDVPGGWCHSFYLNGHRFTPGVHYVGLLEKGDSSSQLYESLGIANDLTFFKMNPSAYEHCKFENEQFDFPSTLEELKERLVARFPSEEKGIHKYLTLVDNVSKQIQLIPKVRTFWDHVTIPFRTKHMGKYSLFSVKRVIGWHLKDPLLKKILNIQFGDHGVPPAQASFPLHCAVMHHYFKGGYYPMGGGGALVKAMTNKIKELGSSVRTSTAVAKILLDDSGKLATGVQLENGEQLFARQIISNADPGITYEKLIGKEFLSKKLLKKLHKTKYSCTSLMLFVTVDTDVRTLGMDSGNIWYMQEGEIDQLFGEMQQADLTKGDSFPGMFISCTTLKDPSSYNGKHHCIEAITYINYDAFSDFKHEDFERSKQYLAYKERITEKMVNTLELAVPGIRQHILYKDLGTPITNEYYINSTRGSVYGTEKTLRQIGPFAFKPKSEFKNLYLCGASISAHGVAGSGYSGVQTAALILGCHQDDIIKTNPNQNITLLEAEDDSDYPDWLKAKIAARMARQQKLTEEAL